MKAEARALARSKATNESQEERSHFDERPKLHRPTANFGNHRDESENEDSELETNLTNDRIQEAQDDFESEMRKRFDQQDVRDV